MSSNSNSASSTITDSNTLTIDASGSPITSGTTAGLASTIYNNTTTTSTFPVGTVFPAGTTTTIGPGIVIPSTTVPPNVNTGGWGYTTTTGTSTYGYTMEPPTHAETTLAPIVERLRSMSPDKLETMGVALKKTNKRYKILDNAYNLAREIGWFDDLEIVQESIWEEIALKVGVRNYNVRDAIWDALLANLLKKDLKQADFILLNMPYGLTCISE